MPQMCPSQVGVVAQRCGADLRVGAYEGPPTIGDCHERALRVGGKAQQVGRLRYNRFWEGGCWSLFYDQMYICASKTEGADACQALTLNRLPRFCLLYKVKHVRLLRKIRVKLLEMQIRRN